MQCLRSSVDGLMKLTPFQGMIDQSIVTNKMLMNVNNQIGNLASEIRNINTSPIRKINQEIEKTPQKIGMAEQDVLSLAEKLKTVETQCRAMGDTSQANKLKEMLKMINSETTDVKGSMNELRQYIEKTFGTDALKQFDKELKNIDKTTKNVSSKSDFGKSLKTALGIGTVALGIRKAYGFLKDATNESIDFVETQNLFNVSMGKTVDQYGNLDREASKYYTKAIAFQEKLSEKLGINIEESMQYQSLFNAMSKSMGIDDKYSYMLSENFTKLGYDLSSLYNINTENAMQKLRAGLSGQTKPLRDLGLDITQQSIEPLLDQLGIERSAKQLSQAEKMIARYILVLRQASLAHGDFAKTMDSPSNQLKVFNAQLTAFKRNTGNLWQGLLGNILPYVNGIMMVINELLKLVAKLFGFKFESQNISAGIGADDLADDLGTATGKAKELKKQLMGFDEIHNITLDKNSSGGSGASVGGIDQRLLDAMKEYDNLMDKVKSKADDIKNKILKWLGFTKDINGNLKWSWKDMNKIAKIITTITGIIGGIYIIGKLTKLVQSIKTLSSVLKTGKGATSTFSLGLQTLGTGIKGTIKWLKDGTTQFKHYKALGASTGSAISETGKQMLNTIPKAVKLGVGIAGLTASSVLAYKSMKELSEGTIETREAMLKLTGSIAGATASGALIGSIFGPAGTAIGALAGFTVSATSALLGYKTEADKAVIKSKEMKENVEKEASAWKELKQSIQEQIDSQLSEMSYIKLLTDELRKLTDENGNVKKGYEDRVNFILNEVNKAFGTEYSLVDGQIVKNGELKTSISEVTDEIYKQIEAKKGQILLEANEKLYTEAVQKKKGAYIQYTEALQAQEQAQKDYNKALEEQAYWENYYDQQAPSTVINRLKATSAVRDYREALDNQNSALKTAEKQYVEYSETVIKYEDLSMAVLTGSTEEKIQAIEKYTNTIQTESGKRNMTLTEELEMTLKDLEIMKKIYSDTGKEITKEEQEAMENRIRIVSDKLVEQTNKVEELTPEQKQAWKILAEGSTNVYNEGISSVDKDTAKKIQQAIDEINNKQGVANQAGINFADEVEKGVNTIDTTEAGRQAVNGVTKGINQNKNSHSLWEAIGGVVSNVQSWFKSLFGIHSPSKVMADLSQYIPLGIAKGIDENTDAVYKSIKDLSNGINKGFSVNPNDFKVDTNQFIDYGQISGAIATQSNFNISLEDNMADKIGDAIVNGLKSRKIQIEVAPDKDGIFKAVRVSANEFTMQTGEAPFPIG